MSRGLLVVALLQAAGFRPAAAQATSGSFAQGIRAYQNLDFGRAAATLRPRSTTCSALRIPFALPTPRASTRSPLRTFVILTAHLSGFGVLWVAQFILLDRVLFVHRVGHLESPR